MTTLLWRYGYSALRAGGYRGARARRFWLNLTMIVLLALLILLRVWPSLHAAVANAAPQTLSLQTTTYYPNCAAARAAGAAPIHSGQSGYRSELDSDNDGTACEPYPK
ncbi:MAG TPA: excalibur calcium-binding domain-containing protein [Rhizomicrobium sp.]|jgi:hypothetical protein|nr:excalibur calcium-binding domain-containing protein [Rhizomicrobium sp.]